MRRTLPAVWHWVQNNQQTHHVSWPTAVAQTSSNRRDRKSTRLNSSHLVISYAVFCLKKKEHRYRLTRADKISGSIIDGNLYGYGIESNQGGVRFQANRVAYTGSTCACGHDFLFSHCV